MASQEETLLLVYNKLREEIVKRVEIEHQILSFTLITLGAVLGVGLELKNILIFQLYPVLVMFLAAAWADNQLRIGELSAFIKERIATTIGESIMGWEIAQKDFYTGRYGIRHYFLTAVGKSAVFYGSQGIVIALICTKFNQSTIDIYTLIAFTATLVTIGILIYCRPTGKMP